MAKANVAPSVERFAALLRGINVGGKNRLAMKDLSALFAEAGCIEVRTYIQSGNVIFRASPKCVSGLASAIQEKIQAGFGLKVPVVLRPAKEFLAVLECNPYLEQPPEEQPDPDELHVMFLAEVPAPAAVAALDPDRSPPDSFSVRGREIFLRLPNGAGRSKLTNAYFDGKLKTISTSRNWRTVLQIGAMLRSETD